MRYFDDDAEYAQEQQEGHARIEEQKGGINMEIKYGGKIYRVHGVRALPGGASGYIVEDQPGHYDCIMNPEEVLGGGYGVNQNGSPYPTKGATFDYPHWKPSEDQIKALESLPGLLRNFKLDTSAQMLEVLCEQLKSL